MFGVVQSKLLNSKVNDHHALAIVTAITDNLSRYTKQYNRIVCVV